MSAQAAEANSFELDLARLNLFDDFCCAPIDLLNCLGLFPNYSVIK